MINLNAITINLNSALTFQFDNYIEVVEIYDKTSCVFMRGVKIKSEILRVHWVTFLVNNYFSSENKFYYFAVKDFDLAKKIKLETGLSPERPTKVILDDKKSFQFGFSDKYPNYSLVLDKVCEIIAHWEYSQDKQHKESLITKSLDKAYC